MSYTKEFTKGSKKASGGGANIQGYDEPLLERVLKEEGVKGWPFNRVESHDIRNYAMIWFKYSKNA